MSNVYSLFNHVVFILSLPPLLIRSTPCHVQLQLIRANCHLVVSPDTKLVQSNMLLRAVLPFLSLITINGQDCSDFILTNGRVKQKQRGQFAIFKCYRSFTLVGASKAMCHSGEWDFGQFEKPTCVRPGCVAIEPQNAELNWKVPNAFVEVTCLPGHKINGLKVKFVSSVRNNVTQQIVKNL